MVGNNVLAQVPDTNDFVAGVKTLLRDDGTATFEFPHLLSLLDELQYDTIYHEHFSYFSFAAIGDVLSFTGSRPTTSRSSGPTVAPGSSRSWRRARDDRRGPDLLSREDAEGLRTPSATPASPRT